MAWSPSSKDILIIANGFNSSAMIYSIKRDKEGTISLSMKWQLLAGQYPTRDSTISDAAKSHDGQVTGRDYCYGDVFYVGEINKNGTSVIVEERKDCCSLLHLVSAEGIVIKTTPLPSQDGAKEVHTVMVSHSNSNGQYVIMAEGGYIFAIDGEKLEISAIFNVVR